MHVKRFKEIFEAVAVHKSVKPEKLPHCAEMEAKGYRIASIGDDKYAFHKNYEADDDIYWLGKDTPDYQYGKTYIATPDIVADKKHNPFYSIFCKCDPGPTDEQKKIIAEREKENKKRYELIQKQIRGEAEKKKKKKK